MRTGVSPCSPHCQDAWVHQNLGLDPLPCRGKGRRLFRTDCVKVGQFVAVGEKHTASLTRWGYRISARRRPALALVEVESERLHPPYIPGVRRTPACATISVLISWSGSLSPYETCVRQNHIGRLITLNVKEKDGTLIIWTDCFMVGQRVTNGYKVATFDRHVGPNGFSPSEARADAPPLPSVAGRD